MPDLTIDQLTLILAIVAGVALISFLLVFILAFRLRSVRREYALLRGHADEPDIVAAVGRFARQLATMEERLDSLGTDLQGQSGSGRLALQRFHLVRYDAFEEMGGRLSFSAAILDDHGDGLILTSINGRTETRTYAKPIKALASDHHLSNEEREAIAGAVAGFERGEQRANAS